MAVFSITLLLMYVNAALVQNLTLKKIFVTILVEVKKNVRIDTIQKKARLFNVVRH